MNLNLLKYLALLTACYDVINNSYVTWLVIANYNCGFGSDSEKSTDMWYTEAPHYDGVCSLKMFDKPVMCGDMKLWIQQDRGYRPRRETQQ